MSRSSSLVAIILALVGFSAQAESTAATPLTVTKVIVSESCLGPQQAQLGKACIGDRITLAISGDLPQFLQSEATLKKGVNLFLNGIDASITPVAVGPASLQFVLGRNADNKKVWATLLDDPFHHRTRSVDASIGLGGGVAVETQAGATFTLVVVQWNWYSTAWVVVLCILLVVFIWLVVKRGIIRDGRAPAPFSLGRTQMAWWFFLIIISYVLIWLISGDRDTITPSLLVLTGISAATALGAVLIDVPTSSALSQAATDRLALLAAQQNARQNVTSAQATATAAPADPVAQKNLADAQAANAVVEAKLLAVNSAINAIVVVPVSRGFFMDLLGDSQGNAEFHRFQIFVWTIVLGIIFVVSVVTNLSMPEFSNTLLATMGISAGTYLGFKIPEK